MAASRDVATLGANTMVEKASHATLASSVASMVHSAGINGRGPTPLGALFEGLRQVVVASLRLVAAIVRFSSVTVPSSVYAVLHYSFTLQLNFPSLLFLFVCTLIAGFVWLRYRHLNRYERLREVPLTKDEGFNLHPDVARGSDDNDRGSFHNYLDDFLQAIRIFGFLEKPVFHELARHLQTRRLVAGDSIPLDSDSSFYIVVDGHVQVFAPMPDNEGTARAADDFEDEEHSGFQLLNEVESGGTLSSLFTILRLFTEDVQLASSAAGDQLSQFTQHREPRTQASLRRASSRAKTSSDEAYALVRPGPGQSRLDATALRSLTPAAHRIDSSEGSLSTQRGPSTPGPMQRSFDTEVHDAHGESARTSPGPSDMLPPAQGEAPFPNFTPIDDASQRGRGIGSMSSPPLRARAPSTATDGRPLTPGSILSGFSGQHGSVHRADAPRQDELGTIGRATVDTTLAVIPAVAFKRLTKKFPNAAAHIVQVILTRLTRVTFQTAHKYLGLTREVMRTEKRINEVACYTLPSAFYEQGGMERLRQRFLPEPKQRGEAQTADPDEDAGYFAQRSSFGHDRRDVSSSTTVSNKTTREAKTAPPLPKGKDSLDELNAWRKTKNLRSLADFPVRTPLSRTSVGPGDLLSMTGTGEDGRPHSPYRDYVSSPKPIQSKRAGMQRDRKSSLVDVRPPNYSTHQERSTDSTSTSRMLGKGSDGSDLFFGMSGLASNIDLKDAVMSCIANSIGLAQATPSPQVSMQASPFLHAQDHLQRSVFKSAFGSLSMLDAAMYENESSLTGPSSMAGGHAVELENEVEIRFFEAGSYLARAGERHAGLFYVIDGFLDIVVPVAPDNADEVQAEDSATRSTTAQVPHANGEFRPRRAGGATSTTRAGQATSRPGQANGNSLDGTQHGERKKPSAQPASSRHRPSQGQRPMYTVGRGGIAGYLSSLLGADSYIDIRAKTDVYVGFLPAKALETMMERRPSVMLTLCKRLLSLLSPLILHIDSALDWQQVNAGQVIFREGEPADSFYIVINGRLRSITEKSGSGVDVLDEHGQGDSVGELDVITRSPRRKTLHAIRDSELAKMPMTLFNAISVRHPAITIQISRIIARRVRDEVGKRGTREGQPLMKAPVPGLPDLGRNNQNLKTVAILPVTRHVPVVDFSNRLQQAFEDTVGGPTAFLNQSSVMGVLGRHAFNRMGKLKLAGWLAEQEQKYRLVLYVVDTAVSSPWTQTSIRQADCVLLVGFGDDPATGEYERLLLGIKTTARKELVLLHPERSVPPGSTREWLKSRPWINAHHHVELPGLASSTRTSYATSPIGDPTAMKALRNLKAKLETSLQRYRRKADQPIAGRPYQCSDFARLARRLCGRSIGVVLGGGGARGCAHVGFLQALEERGIPVDMIGGTSIGSLVGGLYAKEAEIVSSFGRVKKFAGRTASLWRFVLDLTYPVCSYTSGFEFNRGVFKALGETHIEDMWLPYFCNTTNITWSRMEVHTSGYSWRYIRGSMTLAGLIPPLVDDGHMLVDGGYMDNLPVSVMFAMGARDVFAVDVGSLDDTSPRSYGDTLSGWWVVINRYNPWSDARNIPSITDIQGRLTYVSSVKTLEEAKRTPGCLYLRMPVEAYGTMEFGKFTEIYDLGYQAATRALDDWGREGKLPSAYEATDEDAVLRKRQRRGGISARRNSV